MEYKNIAKEKRPTRRPTVKIGELAATVVVVVASASVVATAAAENDDEENDDPAAVAGTESVTHVSVPPFVSSKPFYVN